MEIIDKIVSSQYPPNDRNVIWENNGKLFKIINGKWKEISSGGGGSTISASVEQTDNGAIISITDNEGTTTATVDNGKTPVKGTDYWTESDKQEVIAEATAEIVNPIVYKGTLGVGGTITTLPTASESNHGWQYKVITAGTYNGISANVGDSFISNGASWILSSNAEADLVMPQGFEVNGSVVSFAEGYSLPKIENREETTLEDSQEWKSDDESELYAKIDHNGLTAKDVKDINGNPIGLRDLVVPQGMSISTDSSKGSANISFAEGYSLPNDDKQETWDKKTSFISVEKDILLEDDIEFRDEEDNIAVKINNDGIHAKRFYDLNGNPINSGELGGKTIHIFGGSVSALLGQYNCHKIIENNLGAIVSFSSQHGAGFTNNMTIDAQGNVSYSGVNIQKQVENATIDGYTKYDIYLIWASTNDYWDIAKDTSLIGNVTDYTITDGYNVRNRRTQAGGLNYCIRKLTTFNPSCKIVVIGSLKAFTTEGMLDINGIFKQMVDGQQKSAIRFSLPFFSLYDNSGFNDYNRTEYYYHDEEDEVYGSPAHGDDAIHPNKNGYVVIAGKLSNFLKSI